MNPNSRITLNMSVSQMIIEMSDGIPGCLFVLMDLYTKSPEIDKANALAGFGPIVALDSYRIYGSDVWILYKDICGEKLYKLIAILRAMQLGNLPEETVHTLIADVSNYRPIPDSFNLAAIVKTVKTFLGDDFVIPESPVN